MLLTCIGKCIQACASCNVYLKGRNYASHGSSGSSVAAASRRVSVEHLVRPVRPGEERSRTRSLDTLDSRGSGDQSCGDDRSTRQQAVDSDPRGGHEAVSGLGHHRAEDAYSEGTAATGRRGTYLFPT